MIYKVLCLLFGTILALLTWAEFVQWEARRNADLIKANGSADNLKDGFHQRRTWLRFWWWLGCTTAGCLPPLLWGGVRGIGLGVLFAGLGILQAGYFLRTFNPQLNVLMGLDYKARFYVSYSPTASWLDRFVYQRAFDAAPVTASGAYVQDQANKLLQRYLNYALVASILIYLAAAVAALWVGSRAGAQQFSTNN